MDAATVGDVTLGTNGNASQASGMRRLLVLFALSGTAGLVYEVVWFQLLRLTIGANSQSLGILLACFMGGLFVGSLSYSRWAPKRWDPLRTYAVMELLIGVMGLFMPGLIAWIRTSYLAHAESSQTALLLRCGICVLLLAPPTILMGATLPALSRWVKSDERQAGSIGWLYSANIMGAVVGAFGAAFLLMPWLEIVGANWVAVGLNVLVAAIAWSMRGTYVQPEDAAVVEDGKAESKARFPIYLAYGLNGAASLSFEVVWSRYLGMAFATTVYAFAMVLGVFLFGLGLGGAAGAALGRRLKNPRRAFAAVQLCIVAAVSGTAFLVPFMATQMMAIDRGEGANALTWSLTNLVRAMVVVFPGAFLWGMSFPIALVCLGRNLGDAAKPVGRMYAVNTVGAVIGSLATSFVLVPTLGSAAAVSHLMWLPLAAAVVLLFPKHWPRLLGLAVAIAVAVVVYLTPWPTMWSDGVRRFVSHAGDIPTWKWVIVGPVVVGTVMAMVTRVRCWWAFPLAAAGLVVGLWARVPTQLYMLGRHYAYQRTVQEFAEIIYFEEGVMEPIVVFNHVDGSRQVSINSKICATSQPEDMLTQRMLAHVPVLLSADPSKSVVVGLGAGVTAGAVGIHERVQHVDVIELEPMVQGGARRFAEFNDAVMDNPKVHVTINDGRHFISTSREKFGVITSDPVDPWMAGAAALYTVEYFTQCREHLIEGGTFMQWVGMYELDEGGMKSILAAFSEAFPNGGFWITPRDILLVGSNRPIRIDVAALREWFEAEPAIAESFRYVGVRSVEDFLASYLCSSASMADFLEGAPVNRDSNLYVQFSGGFSYYEWNHPELREMLVARRAWDDDIFVLPEEEKAKLRRDLEAKWERFAKRIARENEIFRRKPVKRQTED